MKIREEEESGEKGTIPAEKKVEFLSRRRRKSLPLLAACKRGFCGPKKSTVTTPVILWKEVVVGGAQNTIIKGNNKHTPFSLSYPSFSLSSSSSATAQFSARRLGFVLWEFQYYYYFSSDKMYLGVNNHNNQRGRRIHHRVNKDEGFDHLHQINGHPSLPVDPHRGGSSDYQPSSAGSLRRHIAASLMRHHQSSERNKHALQPLSPASYGSSLEMAPYNPAATPDSSIELRGRMVEPNNYGFKTSTELLKVLNRIWTLEEQHASNVSLVKALKHELDHARGRIKELLKDQQANRHEIDELMKQISQDNISRKSKEHERIEAALQSVRDELEDERKLRKRSESLHRKLARELFEVKVALSTTVKDLEKETTSSELLEELCDEFAKTIREYAKQVHDVKHKSDRDWTGITSNDNLILHISESWLDERAQRRDREAKRASAVVDKLRPEIETFLTARQTANVDSKETDHKESRLRRRSLESIPEVGTAPEDSAAYSDSRCAEKNKVGPSHYEEQEELALNGRRKGQSPPSVQMSEPQNTPWEIDSRMKTGEGTPTEISMLQKSEIYDSYQKKKNYDEGHGSNSKTVDKLISELLLSEGGSFPPEYEYKEAASGGNPSTLKRNASPVRQWMTNMRSPDPKISESSSKFQSVRENSLKAKLQEPKTKGGQRSRLKILKGLS